MTFFGNLGKGLRPLPRLLAIGALSLPLAACDLDEILAVRDPAQVTPPELDNAQSVPFLVSGAIRQFYGGYSGFGDDAFLIASATITDEMYNGDSFLTRIAGDLRQMQPPLLGNFTDAAYGRLHTARVLANRAAVNADRFLEGAEADETVALMKAIEGYSYVTLAEGWCGSLPFSEVPAEGPLDPNTLAPGTPISTMAALDEAIARFDAAIARAGADTEGGALARVGKARALLDKGGTANYAAAAAAVAGLDGYSFSIEHSSNEGTQNNPVYSLVGNGRYGVSEDEGGLQRHDLCAPASLDPPSLISSPTCADSAGWGTDEGEGMPFRSAMDPRVPWAYAGGAFSGSIRLFWPLEHTSYDDDVYLVDPAEVQLIRAEAQLAAGNAAWLTTLNNLRATAGLGALTDPGTNADRVRMIFQERAFWLYLTGHRQGDLRRMVRNYGFTQAQVWPTGTNLIRATPYGQDVAFPLPFNEENNPNYDPAACNTTQA